MLVRVDEKSALALCKQHSWQLTLASDSMWTKIKRERILCIYNILPAAQGSFCTQWLFMTLFMLQQHITGCYPYSRTFTSQTFTTLHVLLPNHHHQMSRLVWLDSKRQVLGCYRYLGAISLTFMGFFLSTRYTCFGAKLPPKSKTTP